MLERHQTGFTLVELSIVILVLGLLLGGILGPLSAQREAARYRDAQEQLAAVRNAVITYAMVNGNLPCPATAASSGGSANAAGACAVQHGFIPATTMNLNGRRNADNLLLDAWGAPLRYSVTASDADANGQWDFIVPGEMSNVSMQLLQPDLQVCETSVGSSGVACANLAVTLADRAPFVIYTLGRDGSSFSSPEQLENVGATIGGGPSGQSYRVANDPVFVLRNNSSISGAEFDDQVVWTPETVLYGKLVQAGQLP